MTFLSSLEELNKSFFLVDILIMINMIDNVSDRFKIIMKGQPVKASIPGQIMDIFVICPVGSFEGFMLETLIIFFSINLLNQHLNHYREVFRVFLVDFVLLTKVEERSVAHYVHFLHKSHQNVFVPRQCSLSKFPPSFVQRVLSSLFNRHLFDTVRKNFRSLNDIF
jgi:hypothetical protein